MTLRSSEKKYLIGGVAINTTATSLNLEQNPPERMFEIYINNYSLEDFGLFLLATRVLPASPNFRQAKHGQNSPQPLIVNSAFVTLYVGIILPIGPIPRSLFVFDLEAED